MLPVVALLLCMAAAAEGVKIVAFPYPGGVSHVFIMAKVGKELASRGHEVILVTAEMDTEFATARVKGSTVKVLPYNPGYNRTRIEDVTLQCTKESPKQCTVTITETCVQGCLKMFEDESVINAISDAHVVLADIAYPCGYTFVDKFNVPVRVDISPVGFYDPWGAMHWGIPSPTAYVPQLGSKLTNKMNFVERVVNLIIQGVLYGITPALDDLADGLRKQLNITKSHTASARSSGMYLLNVDWATEFPRPITPVTKVVGPILPEPVQPLPADLEEFMAGSPNGVLLVSLGTLAEVVLTDETVHTLAAVFSALPVNVLWKLGRAAPSNLGSNIKMVKWFPQNDLLGHPKTRAFFTHGGMNSVQEAAFHGVPMLGFPQFADQFDNVIRMVAAGTSLDVRNEQLTETVLKEKVTALLEDPSYEQQATKISIRMQDRHRSPTEESADWVEFAIRNDNGQFLRVPSLDMPWYQAQNLDAMAFLFGLLALLALGVFKLLKKLVGRDSALALLAALLAYLIFA